MRAALYIAQSSCAVLAMLEAIISLYLIPSWRNVALLGLTIALSLLLLFLPIDWGIWRLSVAVSALVYIVWNFHVVSADRARKRRGETRFGRPPRDVRNN